MIRVYVDAVADLFHVGHITFFRNARAILADSGDVTLVVGVHSDKTTEGYKRKPVIEQEQRYEIVRACRYVDELIEDAPLIVTPAYLIKHRIDAVVRSDDIQPDNPQIAQVIDKVHWIPYTKGVSTTLIMERIRASSGVAPRARRAAPSPARWSCEEHAGGYTPRHAQGTFGLARSAFVAFAKWPNRFSTSA